MTTASRRRTTWAFALIAGVVAFSVHLTSQIGRNGCIRHGVAGALVERSDAPELAPIAGGEAAHAACALCAAPTATGAATACVAGVCTIRVELRLGDWFAGDRRVATPPPLAYAPKTSPPVA